MQNDPQHEGAVTRTATEARQAIAPGVVRWVLGLSLALAIVALAITYVVVM